METKVTDKNLKTMDGNTAAAYISYAFTEVAAIYPITPSSPMAEAVDAWAVAGKKNIFGEPVKVVMLQSEAGASGTVHGSLKTGALTTTYTASQGLLLMIPNMYKIAGELLPTVFHVAARAVATNALSIFGDHSDVMAARSTGFCMLAESSVQEVMDLSAVAHLASIEGSLPFMNFFDGFRTSHEIQRIEVLDYDDLKKLVDWDGVQRFRDGAMNPNHPYESGTAQNGDIYFQSRETVNQFYQKMPAIVQKYMGEINKLRGTDYDLTNYYGDPEATEVIVLMGSAAPVAKQTVDYLNKQGRKVGFINMHLYRPFPTENLLAKLPKTVQKVAVLDRTKEPGSEGEPMLLDVQSALYAQPNHPIVIGGRYGIASKNVTPEQFVSVFDHLQKPAEELKPRFTVGIVDDVTYTSLPKYEPIDLTPASTFQAKFWGLGSDGTVGANKQAIKIIGDNTGQYAQAYFAYDSKKSGGLTLSHLRFGHEPIDSTYYVEKPDFVCCSTQNYVNNYNLLKGLKDGGTFLLNTIWSEEKLGTMLPNSMKKYIAQHNIKFYIIDAVDIAAKIGLGNRINQVMSTAFFEVTDIMDRDQFVPLLKDQVDKTYGKKSRKIVESNWAAIDNTFDNIVKVNVPSDWANAGEDVAKDDSDKPAFIKNIQIPMNRQEGDDLSVKDLIDNHMLGGKIPMGTAAYEKRGVSLQVPQWDPEYCIQCNQCSFVCPHAAIRPFLATDDELETAPEGFITTVLKGEDGLKYRVQVSIDDCTGCSLCVDSCPQTGKALKMVTYDESKEQARNWAFAMTLSTKVNPFKKRLTTIKGSQFEQPLLEFSGACSGCGETAYIKLITQLYGDHLQLANATGCSSIWGGSSPASAYTTNFEGRGPAWSNSLFEDNAEYGYGMHVANEMKRHYLVNAVSEALDAGVGSDDTKALLQDWLDHYKESEGTRQRAAKLAAALKDETDPKLKDVLKYEDQFAKISQWILGGDGWAYDIGFGGVDQVLSSGEDINIFVMDNELYANTGGQMSKATPASAVAEFAAGGKHTKKKDLGMMAVTYGDVYVAQIALDANPDQAVKAIAEAESYPGPSLVIGYVPCINQGIKGGLKNAVKEAKIAVESGYWQLYRYDPRLAEKGKDPMKVDFKKADFSRIPEVFKNETRYSRLRNVQKDESIVDSMLDQTVKDMEERSENYARMAEVNKKKSGK